MNTEKKIMKMNSLTIAGGIDMKTITVEDLKDIEKVEELCHQSSEPIYIEKDRQVDLVIMSMEVYNNMFGRFQDDDNSVMF
jgi:hypothetical protein